MARVVLVLSLALAGCLSTPSPASVDAGDVDGSPSVDADDSVDGGGLPTCDTTGPTRIRELSAAADHTCAVLTNGLLYCWGQGGWGRLGYGDAEDVGDNETPMSMGPVDLGGACVVQVSAGGQHTCALLEGGGVRCWGRGSVGQLGVAGVESVDAPPTTNVDLSGAVAVQVSAGGSHTCVRLDNHKVRCFGQNDQGQTGHASISMTAALRTNLDMGGDVVDIVSGNSHTCARLDDATVKCWGEGANGALGYGTNINALPAAGSPAVMVGGDVVGLSAGLAHTCAVVDEVATTGAVRCWGTGMHGRLGNENEDNVGIAEHPVSIAALSFGAPVTSIAAGGFHSCVVVAGKVRCWGTAVNGQLGYDDSGDNVGDSALHPLRGDLNTGLDTIVQVVAGREHTCVLSESGRVRCWGRHDAGRLGHGDGRQVGRVGDPITGGGDVPVWCDGSSVACDG